MDGTAFLKVGEAAVIQRKRRPGKERLSNEVPD